MAAPPRASRPVVRTVAASAAVLLTVVLTGCAQGGLGWQGCPSWAAYPNTADAVRDSGLVAHGTVERMTADRLDVRLVDVAKGPEREGTVVHVGPPSACDALTDPGATDVQLLLLQRDGRWTPLTPDVGVRPYDPSTFSELSGSVASG